MAERILRVVRGQNQLFEAHLMEGERVSIERVRPEKPENFEELTPEAKGQLSAEVAVVTIAPEVKRPAKKSSSTKSSSTKSISTKSSSRKSISAQELGARA